jgi:glycerol kinase
MAESIGSIDQGTTSSRFLSSSQDGEPVAMHRVELKQMHPQPGQVGRGLPGYGR